MDLETIINQLPTYIESNGSCGLTIQYKPLKKVWFCSYGARKSTNLDKPDQMHYFGFGDTPYKAVEDFTKKIRHWK